MFAMGPVAKLPKFYCAVNSLEQSLARPASAEDRWLACEKPIDVHPSIWVTEWVSVGAFYSFKRAQECSLAGEGRRAAGWGLAAAAEAALMTTGIVGLLGLIAGGVYRYVRQPNGPHPYVTYVSRTENGVREHMVARSLKDLRESIRTLDGQVDAMCLAGTMSRDEFRSGYMDALGAIEAAKKFIESHPNTRIRGSELLHRRIGALETEVSVMLSQVC